MKTRVWWTALIAVAVATTSCTSGEDRVTFPTAAAPLLTNTSLPASTASPALLRRPPRPHPSRRRRRPSRPGCPCPGDWPSSPMAPPWSPCATRARSCTSRTVPNRSRSDAHPVSSPAEREGCSVSRSPPSFASDRTVFVYLTSRNDNRVMRMTFDGIALTPGAVIVKGIAKAGNHDGGRLAFGPDGYLYISTGDAGVRDPAQDKGSLSGKILRVTPDGAPAPGNPFPRSPIWSLGHRNVQGMAWDKAGRMYASEFGQNTWDELNCIEPGRNYGWPIVEGSAHSSGFVDPIHQWPTADASPSGIAVGADGAIYMAALRGESLWRIPLDGNGNAGTPKRLLQGRYGRLRTVVSAPDGRLRTVVSAPDGRLWLVTSNTF